MKRFGLPKGEHVVGRERVAALFSSAESFVAYPFRVAVKRRNAEPAAVSVLFSVPKKRFKHASDRNRLKRLMRESYRLQKTQIVEKCLKEGVCLDIAFIFISSKLYDFSFIKEKMGEALEKILAEK